MKKKGVATQTGPSKTFRGSIKPHTLTATTTTTTTTTTTKPKKQFSPFSKSKRVSEKKTSSGGETPGKSRREEIKQDQKDLSRSRSQPPPKKRTSEKAKSSSNYQGNTTSRLGVPSTKGRVVLT